MSHLVMFVHGLTGNLNTFGKFPELIKGDPLLKNKVKVVTWKYPSSFFSMPFLKNSPTVQSLANSLRTEITYREEHSVTLVCHSLGGVIARRMLLDDVKAAKTNKVVNLLLCATPIEGSGLANIGKLVSWWQPQIRQLCLNSEFLVDLNNDWHNFEVEGKIAIKYMVGALDNVVSQKSAHGFWGNNAVESIADANHTTIVKPISVEDIRYKILRRLLINYFDNVEVEAEIESSVDKKTVVEIVSTFPDIIGIEDLMNANAIIAQAFLAKSVTWRIATARNLGLLMDGEPESILNKDRLSVKILVRANERQLLGELWNQLFNESLGPNPYK